MSSDKKNEDFAIRMPESGSRSPYGGEKDPFLAARSRQASTHHIPVPAAIGKVDNSPAASILAYCLSSISMTVVNKYVVSGSEWNMNFFYLAVQASPTNSTPKFASTQVLTNL